MTIFPKKYKPQELKNRSKLHKNLSKSKEDSNKSIFLPSFLPSAKKLAYYDFFKLYTKDFFRCRTHIKNIQKGSEYQNFEHLFLFSSDHFEKYSDASSFFITKNQTLIQTWINKTERRILSISKKNSNANNKILNNYFSSPNKFFFYDSNFYLYLINLFKDLFESWKIHEENNIWYRSFNLQSTIPDKHIVRKEEKRPYYVLKYFIWAKWDALYVPLEGDIDLCCWDVGLLVHPKDKRYNKYIWKTAIIPLSNRQIPIIWDENVNIAINNWIKRICPCSDQESIQLAKKYWLPTDIYVFDHKWLYTKYIHDSAFIWEDRHKFYKNIEWFIRDIWNMESEWENIKKVPYSEHTGERLIPYKISELVIDLKPENEKILNDIFRWSLKFSFIKEDFWNIIDEIKSLEEEYNNSINNEEWEENKLIENKNQIFELKTKIWNEIKKYLPKRFVCNNQIPSWRMIPLIRNDFWDLTFFDIESLYSKRNDEPIQKCFNFVLLSLLRIWSFKIRDFWTKKDTPSKRLCKYEKFFTILSQNEKRVYNFINQLKDIEWDNEDFSYLLKIVENLTNDNFAKSECNKLIKNSEFLKQEWDRLFLDNVWWEIFDDYFSADFIDFASLCYISHNNQINNHCIYSKQDRKNLFEELTIEYLLLGKSLYNSFSEISYDDTAENFWNKQLTKLQKEQSQRDLFSLYWENPIRLTFLTKNTYDQNEIILNNIFLKQVRNATRLCVQKWFLPKDISWTLDKTPKNIDGFDLSLIYKLNNLYEDWQNISNIKSYINFFYEFKASVQNLFFSRYLETQKSIKTDNVQFVCSYFFNFLLTVLYPFIPEYVNALCHISQRDFLTPLHPIQINKNNDYNMNILYDIFIKIKNIKIEFNIKQHESCNIFIKSSPTLWDLFQRYEQIFKNYFHIKNVIYLRLHEKDPIWYETHSDENLSLWIQLIKSEKDKDSYSVETIENEIKNIQEKLDLIRQRLQILPEWQQRQQAEEEYAKTKEEMETLTIKYSLLNSK